MDASGQALAEALLFEASFETYRYLPDPRMVRVSGDCPCDVFIVVL